MMTCPIIKMPDYFTRLLRGNMQPTGDLFRSLGVYVHEQAPLNALILHCLSDIDPHGRLDFFIKNLGWIGFRNRLASIFLFYSDHGHFPDVTDPQLVDDIVYLEELYKTAQVPNYSRVFLLGFYLELSARSQTTDSFPSINAMASLYGIFGKFAQSKVVKLDILLLTLWHLSQFLGLEVLGRLIDQGVSYEQIIQKLERDQQRLMIANLLNYGASVGEEEIFCSRMV